MDIKELKARAYDILAEIEYLQAELRKVNTEIVNWKPAEITNWKPEEVDVSV